MYTFLTTSPWADYELIDAGNFEKLERFGKHILARPEPQAIWDPHLPASEWQRANAIFTREKGSQERGQWKIKPGTPEQWVIGYERPDGLKLRFRLGMSSFKHVGLFPEQDPNWQFIYNQTRQRRATQPRVLNLFAYTGAATLAARAAGADVTHLDSVKQVNFWARDNMEASNLDGVRWLVEDAMKYVRREVKRGSKYQGLILDPPAYGRGPNGEKWQLEDELNEMLKLCKELLDPEDHFFLINLYSLGFSALILENLIHEIFPQARQSREIGEIYLHDKAARKLPLGTFCRFAV
ncbi:23S rRNA (cytosine1962-C5)-methyltransferase [Hymenobacter luteus]|uniref:23S rRNA (Cytosine1962-C5)-methyltransferase n=2 Tax=Hymenobacter TaxID=89966 RepID=A0A7W9WAU0_9BACT|nr:MULTISPECIES: class I SAM-dependent methyltransferase [Hymenobacter]MBB4600039.1 23S rRNA (cytosine1962-C5)-methyltransferase [Hymenobacter latericoloratus]MBB6057651.1 23S rRNA (cytosine1962-C5)-methyltransferase [Hymenobacter luteus]